MKKSPKFTISFVTEIGEETKELKIQLPYTGDYDNLTAIVSSTFLALYDLGWDCDSVEKAVKEVNIF